MSYKTLEKAHKLYEKIKAIDQEIIAIDKMALHFAEADKEINLRLSHETIVDKIEKPESEPTDWYSIMRRSLISSPMYFGIDLCNGDSKTVKTENFSASISNNAALQILGILLAEKHTKRANLISECEKLMKKANVV